MLFLQAVHRSVHTKRYMILYLVEEVDRQEFLSEANGVSSSRMASSAFR